MPLSMYTASIQNYLNDLSVASESVYFNLDEAPAEVISLIHDLWDSQEDVYSAQDTIAELCGLTG